MSTVPANAALNALPLAGPAATFVPWNFAPTIERLTFGCSAQPQLLLQQRALHAQPQVELASQVALALVLVLVLVLELAPELATG